MDLVVRVAVVRVAGIRQAPVAQFGDGLLEVIERLEAPVDRGEPDVGDLVELLEMLEHDLADRLVDDLLEDHAPTQPLLQPALTQEDVNTIVKLDGFDGKVNPTDMFAASIVNSVQP